jgi:single-strand DNA-binding protein
MYNRVILTGNTGNDPEVRFTPNGQQVARFSVATNEYWTDRAGEKQQRTEWHKVVAWGRLAEVIGKYLTKGRLVTLEGSLRTRKYKDRDNNERTATEIIANRVAFLGGNPAAQKPRDNGSQPDVATEEYQGNGNPEDQSPPPLSDEDIPF